MKGKAGLILLGLLCYLAFLLANVPARHAWGWAASSAEMPLVMGGISGTIWSGEARQLAYNGANLGGVKWRLSPRGLLQGSLLYRFNLRGQGQQLAGTAGLAINGDLIISKLKGMIKAELVARMMRQRFIQPAGDVDLDLHGVRVEQGRPNAVTGTIRWQSAGVKSPVTASIGSIEFNISSREGDIKTTIRDLGGPLSVKGNAALNADGNYQISVRMLPKGSADPGLVQAIRALGQQDGSGGVNIKYSGQL